MWTIIKVCEWHACKSNNSKYVKHRACNDLKIPEIWWVSDSWITVEWCLCLWKCDVWPNVKIVNWEWKETIHSKVSPRKMSDIVSKL